MLVLLALSIALGAGGAAAPTSTPGAVGQRAGTGAAGSPQLMPLREQRGTSLPIALTAPTASLSHLFAFMNARLCEMRVTGTVGPQTSPVPPGGEQRLIAQEPYQQGG